jgi:hypothetical protein
MAIFFNQTSRHYLNPDPKTLVRLASGSIFGGLEVVVIVVVATNCCLAAATTTLKPNC